MKFIRTSGGQYINADLVRGFFVIPDGDNDGGYIACAQMEYDPVVYEILKNFSCDPKSTTQFDPRAEAQGWLDNLVAELNGDIPSGKNFDVFTNFQTIAIEIRDGVEKLSNASDTGKVAVVKDLFDTAKFADDCAERIKREVLEAKK